MVILGFTTPPRTPSTRRNLARQAVRLLGLGRDGWLYARRYWLAAGVCIGLVVGIVSGWYALIGIIPAAVVVLPALLRAPAQSREAKKAADLTAWVRSLSGALVGGQSGLEVAIRTTTPNAPESLRPSLMLLVARLDATQPLAIALRTWADDVNDASADLIAAALILEANRRGGVVSATLDGLARSLADQSKAVQDIENERSSARTTIRLVTITTIAVVTLAAFSGYMDPYATPLGQVIFTVLCVGFAATLFVMRKIGLGKPVTRFLPPSKGA
jgi:F0F1-type ATP synthase assembly protein I